MTKTETKTDATGYEIFSSGDVGAAHEMAHRMLDEGREHEGYVRLKAWLGHRSGSGSEWVHIQWHMAVFEIWAGELESARARYEREILPAVATGQALTDGPSLLWRLLMASESSAVVDWEPIRQAALAIEPSDHPYVDLHRALAFAGAGDVGALTEWLDQKLAGAVRATTQTLLGLGWALRCYASGDYRAAATLFDQVVSRVGELGGSRAQNEVFVAIRDEAYRRQTAAVA